MGLISKGRPEKFTDRLADAAGAPARTSANDNKAQSGFEHAARHALGLLVKPDNGLHEVLPWAYMFRARMVDKSTVMLKHRECNVIITGRNLQAFLVRINNRHIITVQAVDGTESEEEDFRITGVRIEEAQ